jgi:hypothetical protein
MGQAVGRQPARRRAQHQVDHHIDAEGNRHHQPGIEQGTRSDFARRHQPEFVEPKADDHRHDGADRPQLAGRGQEQYCRRHHRHARHAAQRVVDAEIGEPRS